VQYFQSACVAHADERHRSRSVRSVSLYPLKGKAPGTTFRLLLHLSLFSLRALSCVTHGLEGIISCHPQLDFKLLIMHFASMEQHD